MRKALVLAAGFLAVGSVFGTYEYTGGWGSGGSGTGPRRWRVVDCCA